MVSMVVISRQAFPCPAARYVGLFLILGRCMSVEQAIRCGDEVLLRSGSVRVCYFFVGIRHIRLWCLFVCLFAGCRRICMSGEM